MACSGRGLERDDINPSRKEARDVVFKDRHDRKYGCAVDTGGAIARALERAYKQGFADAQGDPLPAPATIPVHGPLD